MQVLLFYPDMKSREGDDDMTNTAVIRRTTVFHSIQARTAAVLAAIAAAVALPELFHAVGP